MSERSDLYNVLKTIDGVTDIDEGRLLKKDELGYTAVGNFDYSSDPNDGTYSINYFTSKRAVSYSISLAIHFIYEKVESSIDECDLLKLIDAYNRTVIGIKVTNLPQERDDELRISLKTEFYTPAENCSLEDFKPSLWIMLRFLENAPTAFSRYLRKHNIKHDYLFEDAMN